MSGLAMRVSHDRPVSTPEAPLLRRTRRRLIAWSAGSTFVVLVVLGVAIYAAAASSLAASGEAQLEARAVEMTNVAFRAQLAGAGERMLTVTNDPSQPGVVFGGATSGTIGFVVDHLVGSEMPVGMGMPVGAGTAVPWPVTGPGPVDAFRPDALTLAAIAEGRRVMLETTIGTAPVRVLAQPIETPAGRLVAFVMGDRTAELDTLRTLLLVLLGGGLAVLAASVAVGNVYAGRALVPIRESLERQREFAADASHELRTPLAITRAAIAELRRGRDDPATVDRAIDDLDAGAARMEHLVADLLVLARTDAEAVELAMTDTDLANAAAEATESLEPVAAQRGVRLVLEVVPAPVRGDDARLRQLAAILVDNAIRHSPSGGRVTVTAGPGPWLSVEDEGPGIDPAHLDQVFERFWRAPDAPSGGTGLGLAIARWIAERHGGSIQASGRAGGQAGARFTVRLPAA
jgi:signal transduction histidine kinase